MGDGVEGGPSRPAPRSLKVPRVVVFCRFNSLTYSQLNRHDCRTCAANEPFYCLGHEHLHHQKIRNILRNRYKPSCGLRGRLTVEDCGKAEFPDESQGLVTETEDDTTPHQTHTDSNLTILQRHPPPSVLISEKDSPCGSNEPKHSSKL